MRKAETIIVGILLAYFAFTATSPAMAQYPQYRTGVRDGDWITYDFDISYIGASYKGKLKVTIQSVNDTYITGTVESSGNFPGMFPVSQSFSIFIPTWSSIGGFLIPSNLTTGQTIPGIYPTTTVQDTVDWQGRKAVKAITSMTSIPAETYWDQATGALLEAKSTMVGATFSIKATGTNMFSIGGFDWLLWAIIIIVVAVVVVAVVMILRRKKPPISPAPSQTQPPPTPPQ